MSISPQGMDDIQLTLGEHTTIQKSGDNNRISSEEVYSPKIYKPTYATNVNVGQYLEAEVD